MRPPRRPDYSQLNNELDIYFLVSGGRDSTAMVLEASILGIHGTMLYNDTHFNRCGRDVLERIAAITGFPLKILRYDGERRPIEILRESFKKIPQVEKKMRETGKYRKNYFYCCRALKHKPTEDYLKSLQSTESVLVSGIKGSDGSANRRFWLAELREQGTFFRRHKRNGRLYYYPLRDCSNADIRTVLAEWNLTHIKSTGCSLCPVFCLFPGMRKSDPNTFIRSVRYAKQLGIKFELGLQTELREFCQEVAT